MLCLYLHCICTWTWWQQTWMDGWFRTLISPISHCSHTNISLKSCQHLTNITKNVWEREIQVHLVSHGHFSFIADGSWNYCPRLGGNFGFYLANSPISHHSYTNILPVFGIIFLVLEDVFSILNSFWSRADKSLWALFVTKYDWCLYFS